MRKTTIIIIALLILSLLASIILYPQMPEQMVSHWNAEGEPDDYMSKFWGLFLMPMILLVMVLLFLAIPLIDPLKANIKKFRNYFDGFIIVLMLFFMVIHAQTILWSMGIMIAPNVVFPIMLGVLMYYIGVMLGHTKKNWFVGIRTPWTLSSELVWDKTHKMAGKLFKIVGFISLFGVFFNKYAIYVAVVPILCVSFYSILYSYLEFKKLKAKK